MGQGSLVGAKMRKVSLPALSWPRRHLKCQAHGVGLITSLVGVLAGVHRYTIVVQFVAYLPTFLFGSALIVVQLRVGTTLSVA